MTAIADNSPLGEALKTINSGPAANPSARTKSGLGALDQGDFLKLLVTQLQQQDPLAPVDNKEMLAQMAQFSTLAGTTETNAVLADISGKLDTLIALQKVAGTINPAS